MTRHTSLYETRINDKYFVKLLIRFKALYQYKAVSFISVSFISDSFISVSFIPVSFIIVTFTGKIRIH